MSESNVTTTPASPASANGLGYGAVKPLAVRLNESTRTQLDIIAQLNDRTVTDEIRLAVEAWIDKTKADRRSRHLVCATRFHENRPCSQSHAQRRSTIVQGIIIPASDAENLRAVER